MFSMQREEPDVPWNNGYGIAFNSHRDSRGAPGREEKGSEFLLLWKVTLQSWRYIAWIGDQEPSAVQADCCNNLHIFFTHHTVYIYISPVSVLGERPCLYLSFLDIILGEGVISVRSKICRMIKNLDLFIAQFFLSLEVQFAKSLFILDCLVNLTSARWRPVVFADQAKTD